MKGNQYDCLVTKLSTEELQIKVMFTKNALFTPTKIMDRLKKNLLCNVSRATLQTMIDKMFDEGSFDLIETFKPNVSKPNGPCDFFFVLQNVQQSVK